MRIELSPEAERDTDSIAVFLARSYLGFGYSATEAFDMAASRTLRLVATARRIATAPHRGERHDHLLPGLRHLTLDDAVFYFVSTDQAVRIVAIFWSGQDHHRIIADRIAALR